MQESLLWWQVFEEIPICAHLGIYILWWSGFFLYVHHNYEVPIKTSFTILIVFSSKTSTQPLTPQKEIVTHSTAYSSFSGVSWHSGHHSCKGHHNWSHISGKHWPRRRFCNVSALRQKHRWAKHKYYINCGRGHGPWLNTSVSSIHYTCHLA